MENNKMARFSNMSVIQATSKICQERFEEQLKSVILDQNEYYESIGAKDMPKGTYERAMYDLFIESIEYKKYILCNM